MLLNEKLAPDASLMEIPTDRWTWGETSYNIQELLRLDVPLQQALFRGLNLLKKEAAPSQDSGGDSNGVGNSNSSSSVSISISSSNGKGNIEIKGESNGESTGESNGESNGEASGEGNGERNDNGDERELDFISTLQLKPVMKVESIQENQVSRPELSGEWTRPKSYICSPCGEPFHDFFALLDHQQDSHSNVWCTHIQLDQSMESVTGELSQQIVRSVSHSTYSTAASTGSGYHLKCTKCNMTTRSRADLHSHILQCSNHAVSSPSRKRRAKISASKRNRWQNAAAGGRSRGMQRSNSSQSKNTATSRSLRSRSPKNGKSLRGSFWLFLALLSVILSLLWIEF